MKLSALDHVDSLRGRLRAANDILKAFEAAPEFVACKALTDSTNFGRSCSVELAPVPRELAVSAAASARSKIISELAQLGVEVDEVEGS